jgi:multidrug efflux pump subunit AcrA (membrane-fusion protein)
MAANRLQAAVETIQARVVESQQREVPVNVRATGAVHARETAQIVRAGPGRIQQVLVREGDSGESRDKLGRAR